MFQAEDIHSSQTRVDTRKNIFSVGAASGPFSENNVFPLTILTQMMADDFNFLWSKIENYIAEADADLVSVEGQLELRGRYRCGVLLSPCFGALFVAQI